MNELDRRFTYHEPDEGDIILHQQARDHARLFAEFVLLGVPPGREASLALTKIEEALFWANAAIAREGLLSTSTCTQAPTPSVDRRHQVG